MLASFGDKVTPFAIEKIVMAENQKIIVAIISKKLYIVKSHFLPDIGFIQCFEGKCCKDHGLPAVRYGFPVVQYTTDGGLKIISNELMWDKMLVVGLTDYNGLITKNDILVQQGTDIFQRDILVTCTESTYQKRTFDIMGESKWKNFTNKEEYGKHMELFMEMGELTFGRKVDEVMYNKLLETVTQGPIIDRPVAGRRPLPSAPQPQIESKAVATKVENEVITKEISGFEAQSPVKEQVLEKDDFNDMF